MSDSATNNSTKLLSRKGGANSTTVLVVLVPVLMHYTLETYNATERNIIHITLQELKDKFNAHAQANRRESSTRALQEMLRELGDRLPDEEVEGNGSTQLAHRATPVEPQREILLRSGTIFEFLRIVHSLLSPVVDFAEGRTDSELVLWLLGHSQIAVIILALCFDVINLMTNPDLAVNTSLAVLAITISAWAFILLPPGLRIVNRLVTNRDPWRGLTRLSDICENSCDFWTVRLLALLGKTPSQHFFDIDIGTDEHHYRVAFQEGMGSLRFPHGRRRFLDAFQRADDARGYSAGWPRNRNIVFNRWREEHEFALTDPMFREIVTYLEALISGDGSHTRHTGDATAEPSEGDTSQ